MDKIFFRCTILTLMICIISWHSPTYGRARSGEEGSRGGMGTCRTTLNKLDGSNESIIFPVLKSAPLLGNKLVEIIEKDDLTSEHSTMDIDTDPDLFVATERIELKDNNIPYFQQMGISSWYGEEFDGKITASGEVCNIRDMVASHKTLPFGTIVEINNNLTGQSVIVRINDRGPFVSGRIINLSRSAAEKLGLIEKGIAEVTIRTVGSNN